MTATKTYSNFFENFIFNLYPNTPSRVCFNCGKNVATDNDDDWFFCEDCKDCHDNNLPN